MFQNLTDIVNELLIPHSDSEDESIESNSTVGELIFTILWHARSLSILFIQCLLCHLPPRITSTCSYQVTLRVNISCDKNLFCVYLFVHAAFTHAGLTTRYRMKGL